jgi:hypothetical protein
MTSYRVLAEADAFLRRRLVSAFVSRIPVDRAGEQPRPLRCVIGGLLLAAVLAGGVAGSRVVTGHPVVTRDHGLVRVSP